MAYERTVWRDHIVARPRTYTMVQNEDGTVTLTPAYGAVSQQGTPVNAANLNKLEAAAEDLDGRATGLDTRVESLEGKIAAVALTLTASGWSGGAQTVSVAGLTAADSVIVTPAPASRDYYINSDVRCTAQGAGTLTFTAASTPTANITVNIIILKQ